ncbi:MAG: hypothetical protein IK083_07185 [Abditibacteriota bacterium]|nr:hypothetical protein [Abditibacteriota bacterium]
MKRLLFAVLLAALCAGAFAAEFAAEDGSVKLRAKSISMNKKVVTAKGGTSLAVRDEEAFLQIECRDLKLVYEGKAAKGLEGISQAVITEGVVMEYKAGDSQYHIWCDSAFYENDVMTLAGSVRIDSVVGDTPMTATGSRATINLSRTAGEDEQLFAIEGDSERARVTLPVGKGE